MSYFIKQNRAEFSVQVNTFADGIVDLAKPLGFSPAEVKEAQDDATYMSWLVTSLDKAENFGHGYMDFANLVRHGEAGVTVLTKPADLVIVSPLVVVLPDIQGRLAAKANKAKVNPNCTIDMQRTLGIAPASDTPASSAVAAIDNPDMTLRTNAGEPEVSFHKYKYEGINLYRDKGDGKGYGNTPYKTLMHSPFLDKDLPAVGVIALYKYKSIYILLDKETGAFSPEVSITVVGK